MFLTQGKPERGRLTPFRYGTAGTTTTTSLASQGGLLINIDSATGDIARTTSGIIESNTAINLGIEATTTAISAEFDSAVARTGRLTLKLSTTNATGKVLATLNNTETPYNGYPVNLLYKNAIPVKPSTKYKYTCWVKTNNVAASSVNVIIQMYGVTGTRNSQNFTNNLSGTNDWTLLYKEITTGASDAFAYVIMTNNVVGNISDAWFDINSMTLEEVIEPVANSLVTPSPSLVSFTAVGSTDNIDTSLDPTFVAVNTYTPPVAISEAAADRQTFVPTKSKVSRIGVYPVAKGTGNWTVTVHDASNVVQATIAIANASLTNGAVNYFNVPCNLTALGTYHFHVTSTVADGTVKVTTLNDLETVSYIQNYYKPTTNFKASQNNLNVSISADEDGFLDGSVINRVNGTFATPDLIKTKWDGTVIDYTYTGNDIRKHLTYYTATNVSWSNGGAINCVLPTNSSNGTGYVVKVKMPINITSLNISYAGNTTPGTSIVRYSYNLSSWTTLGTTNHATEFDAVFTTYKNFSFVPTGNTVYIEFGFVSLVPRIGGIIISGTVDTSSLSTLCNYPTNKDIIKQYSTTLSGATTSATYRATKWGFPAIEYSATEYQFLDVDTTATGSTVAFSELGASYTTVADGASLAITSTSTPNIFVKANITANRLLISSNDLNASSDKDGSLRQSVVYQVIQ